MASNYFLYFCFLVRGFHRRPVEPAMQSFDVLFVLSLKKLLKTVAGDMRDNDGHVMSP